MGEYDTNIPIKVFSFQNFNFINLVMIVTNSLNIVIQVTRKHPIFHLTFLNFLNYDKCS